MAKQLDIGSHVRFDFDGEELRGKITEISPGIIDMNSPTLYCVWIESLGVDVWRRYAGLEKLNAIDRLGDVADG